MSETLPKTTLPKTKAITSDPKKALSTIRKKKATVSDYNQRLADVQLLLLEGRTRTYIHSIITARYNVGFAMVDKYMGEASVIIKESNLVTIQENLATVTANLWDLYRKTAKDNLSEAHKVLMSIAKLRGLNENTVNLVIEDKRELSEMSDDELSSILGVE